MKTYFFLLIVLLTNPSPSHAQSTFRLRSLGQGFRDARIQRIDAEVLTSATFPNMTFVLTDDDIPQTALVPGNLQSVVSVKEAIEKGRPDTAVSGLLNRLLGCENVFRCDEAKLLNLGETYVWVLSYTLSVKEGGSTGIPHEWQSVVTHDGMVIFPNGYLQTHFPLYDGFFYDGDKETVFCTLPIKNLTASPETLSGESLQHVEALAKNRLLDALHNAGFDCDIAHKSTVSVEFPGIDRSLPKSEALIAWAISFELNTGADHSPVFQVWANDRGVLGTLSVGTWNPSKGEPSDAPESAIRGDSAIEDQPRRPGDR